MEKRLITIIPKFYKIYLQKLFSDKWKLFNYLCQIFGYYSLTKKLYYLLTIHTYKIIKKIPLVKNKINQETQKIITEIKTEFQNELTGTLAHPILLEDPLTEDQIINQFEKMKSLTSYNYLEGRVSGAVYSNNKQLDSLLHKLYPYFAKSNPLHTNVFPSIRKMENDILKMMAHLFHGNEDTCGTFTSGGTESILLACKTYRDRAIQQGITHPNIIVSNTAHCAFKKACKYFKIEFITIPCLKDGLYDLTTLRNTINSDTCMVVGSAPCYNLGLVDPIKELANICQEHKIGLHVDCCMGAFLVNFSEYQVYFNIPGVTSISADIHKYGSTPKGASVILYHHRDLLRYQYFIDDNWSGGVYATSTIAGSKSGNIVALSWATLLFHGLKRYRENYQEIVSNMEYCKQKIKEIEDLYIFGEPKLNIIAMGSNTKNMYILGEALKKKKWDINMIQNPDGFHFCVTKYHHQEIIDEFISDLKTLLPETSSKIEKSKCIYGTMKTIQDTDIISNVITEYLHVLNGL